MSPTPQAVYYMQRALDARARLRNTPSPQARASLLQITFAAMENVQSTAFRHNDIHVRCPEGGGCWACCCERVEVGQAEIEMAARYLRHVANREEIFGKLMAWLSMLARLRSEGKMEPMDYFAEQLRCPFLEPESNRCSIYAVRPGPCRTYASIDDPEVCHETMADERWRELMRPTVPMAITLGLGIIGDETFIFQEGVAHHLGLLTREPLPVHDTAEIFQTMEQAVANA